MSVDFSWQIQRAKTKYLFHMPGYLIDYGLSKTLPGAQPILILGFWRSGTTWVQEALANAMPAKTVFEPFSSRANPPFNPFNENNLSAEAYMPTTVMDLGNDGLHFIDRAFQGACKRQFAFYCRKSVFESFRRDVIIKLVRAHFIAQDLIERHNPKVIHVIRHPMAIIHSFVERPWQWTFDDVSFAKMYENTDHLHLPLQHDLEKLKGYDDANTAEKICAFWAISEKHLSQIQAPQKQRILYEHMVLRGPEAFSDLCNHLNIHAKRPFQLEKDSVVTSESRKNISKEARLFSWRQKLDPDIQKTCTRIIEELWPEGAEKFLHQQDPKPKKSISQKRYA